MKCSVCGKDAVGMVLTTVRMRSFMEGYNNNPDVYEFRCKSHLISEKQVKKI